MTSQAVGSIIGGMKGTQTMKNASKVVFVNNTNLNVSMFDRVILAACATDGVLPDDISDTFKLTKCTAGSYAEWALDLI